MSVVDKIAAEPKSDTSPERRYWAPRGEHRVSFREYPGRGPAIIFCHGFPDNGHLWDAVLPHLKDRHVVVIDFLGWGQSDKPRNYDYSFAGQLADISAVVDYLRLGRVELVGHDSGLPAAMDWALDHPDRVDSVTLMNGFYLSAAGVRPPAVISLLIFGQLDASLELGILPPGITGGMNDLGEAFEQDENLFRHVMTWQQRRFFAKGSDADHFVPIFMKQFEGPDNSIAPLRSLTKGTFQNVAMHAARVEQMRTLAFPVHCVWGGKDQDLKTEAGRVINSIVPKGRLTVFDDASHNVPIDEAERVAIHLLEAAR